MFSEMKILYCNTLIAYKNLFMQSYNNLIKANSTFKF